LHKTNSQDQTLSSNREPKSVSNSSSSHPSNDIHSFSSKTTTSVDASSKSGESQSELHAKSTDPSTPAVSQDQSEPLSDTLPIDVGSLSVNDASVLQEQTNTRCPEVTYPDPTSVYDTSLSQESIIEGITIIKSDANLVQNTHFSGELTIRTTEITESDSNFGDMDINLETDNHDLSSMAPPPSHIGSHSPPISTEMGVSPEDFHSEGVTENVDPPESTTLTATQTGATSSMVNPIVTPQSATLALPNPHIRYLLTRSGSNAPITHLSLLNLGSILRLGRTRGRNTEWSRYLSVYNLPSSDTYIFIFNERPIPAIVVEGFFTEKGVKSTRDYQSCHYGCRGKNDGLRQWILGFPYDVFPCKTNSWANRAYRTHLKLIRNGMKPGECDKMPELFKAATKFRLEDFYKPLDLAQFGLIIFYFRFLICLMDSHPRYTQEKRPHLTALCQIGWVLTAFAAECGVIEARRWLEAERGRNVDII
jgi:hypothetical protein